MEPSPLPRRKLGRTGLDVTAFGLGCGGFSRIGKDTGQAHAVSLVRQALEAGVNFFDTAMAYGTEPFVGEGILGVPREEVVLCTKFDYWAENSPKSAAEIEQHLDDSLARLRTDYVDVYLAHGVRPAHYRHVRDGVHPVLRHLQTKGKVRFVGMSEAFEADRSHAMLSEATREDLWDVLEVGINLLNQSYRAPVLEQLRRYNAGVLAMFVVRRNLATVEHLRAYLAAKLSAPGAWEASLDALEAALARWAPGCTLADVAYRFVREEPGVHVVLSGTGNADHLASNIASLRRPTLDPELLAWLREHFGQFNDLSGQ